MNETQEQPKSLFTEIERRFLSHADPDSLLPKPFGSADKAFRIRQGYVRVLGLKLRVRDQDGGWFLTYKRGQGAKRIQIEFRLYWRLAQWLFRRATGLVIEKTRLVFGRWEVDVFAGDLAGLILAECELSEGETLPAAPEILQLGREVTDEISNPLLAKLTTEEARALVARLKAEA